MGLSDRLAPVCTELLGRAFERKPFVVEHRRKLVSPAFRTIFDADSKGTRSLNRAKRAWR